jgi:long-chain fatty acid transport protein
MRATLIYNSAIAYDMTGTYTIGGGTTPIYGAITMPQSIELKAQSGVAPGWLAFGAIKWTDWSVAQSMPLCVVGTSCVQLSGLTLLWKDTWTITLGAARQVTEAFSLAGGLTWDQGATDGFTSQTDTLTANLTAVLFPHENVELKFGGTVGVLTAGTLDTGLGGTNPFGYTASFGDDLVYTLSASAAVHY